MSRVRACRLLGLNRSSLNYQSKRPDDSTVRQRLRELAAERRRFGYRRLGWLLAREGHVMNRKKLYRIYRRQRGHGYRHERRHGRRIRYGSAGLRLRTGHGEGRQSNGELPSVNGVRKLSGTLASTAGKENEAGKGHHQRSPRFSDQPAQPVRCLRRDCGESCARTGKAHLVLAPCTSRPSLG